MNPGRGQEIFLFSKRYRLGLGPTQPPIKWVTVFFPVDKVAKEWKLTTHLHLVLRFRMSGAIPLLPYLLLQFITAASATDITT